MWCNLGNRRTASIVFAKAFHRAAARVRQVPHRALVNRAAQRLGRAASIPRARTTEFLAGGTREKGPAVMEHAGAALTAPVPGALLPSLVSALVPACRLRRRYAHA